MPTAFHIQRACCDAGRKPRSVHRTSSRAASVMFVREDNDELTQNVEKAMDRFASEQDITREEALAVIARDWVIGQGYLAAKRMRTT